MDIRAAQLVLQLLASARHESTKTSGAVTIGQPTTTLDFSALMDNGDGVAYAVKFDLGLLATANFNLAQGTVAGAAAGTAHVETATVVHASSTPGTDTKVVVTITTSIYSAANKAVTVNIPSAATDAAGIATLIRAALTADTDIAAHYTVGGTGADVVLTHIVNDGADIINIALANGSPTAGITAAPTSTTTTSGVGRVVITDGDDKDFEGTAIPTINTLHALLVIVSSGGVTLQMDSGTVMQLTGLTSVSATMPNMFLLANPSTVMGWQSNTLDIIAEFPATTATVIVFGSV
jgi:hypothetical protein